jgi:hypothetical protein
METTAKGRNMSLLVIFTVLVQVFFIAHAVYGHRPFWWAMVILIFPVTGCIAYCIVEILLESRLVGATNPPVDEKVEAGPEPVPAPEFVKNRVEELTEFGSVNDKLALARQCILMAAHADAVRLFESCVAGVHADDPHLLCQLADAYLICGQHEQAERLVGRIQSTHPAYRAQEVSLLLARALEGQNKPAAALELYQGLVETYVGFEAKARYGLLLKALGYTRQARTIFSLIVGQARRASALVESEKQWVRLAYQETLMTHETVTP